MTLSIFQDVVTYEKRHVTFHFRVIYRT